MAVTGIGTQQDPWIVTNYEDFISLSNTRASVSSNDSYIQFFDNEHPNQVIDCNSYGSEFKWDTFTAALGDGGTYTPHVVHINLNGCTIKNFLIKEGVPMFTTQWNSMVGSCSKLIVSNGYIRNVFMGSSGSRLFNNIGYMEFHDISFSVNNNGSVVTLFDSTNDRRIQFDNCALYLAQAKAATSIMAGCDFTDSDFDLNIGDQNQQSMFPNCSFTDCRFQGKLGGSPIRAGNYPSFFFTVFGFNTNGAQTGDTVLTNCVVDIDISDQTPDWSGAQVLFYVPSNGATLNTNIFCNSHCPEGYNHPSDWNYISHTLMRNGAYLNNAGFTVVQVLGSGD